MDQYEGKMDQNVAKMDKNQGKMDQNKSFSFISVSNTVSGKMEF